MLFIYLFIGSHLLHVLFEIDLRQPVYTFGETEAKQCLMRATSEYYAVITPVY